MSTTDSGIAVGLKKGFLVTKRDKRPRPSQTKGVSAICEILCRCGFLAVLHAGEAAAHLVAS